MPKKKIKSAVSKRFKVTKTGKVLFAHQYNGHLMTHKSGSRKRRLNIPGVLAEGFARKVRFMLGVSTKRKIKATNPTSPKTTTGKEKGAVVTA